MEDITIPTGYDAKIEGDKVVFFKKESEDERIRKALIKLLNEGKDLICWAEMNGYNLKDAIAYLERQKEQAPEIPDTIAFQEGVKEGRRLEREEHKSYEGEPMEIRYAKRVYKVHGTRVFPGGGIGYIIEDEPGHYDCIVNPDEVLGGGYGIKSGGSPYPTNAIAFSEQSARWSDEDEVAVTSIIDVLKKFEHQGATDIKIDWLKSLPERFK